MPEFDKNEFSVGRQHEEFLWLHDVISNNDLYSGYIIPPPPPKPDFDASREKLLKLSDDEEIMTESEFNKMKEELGRNLSLSDTTKNQSLTNSFFFVHFHTL